MCVIHTWHSLGWCLTLRQIWLASSALKNMTMKCQAKPLTKCQNKVLPTKRCKSVQCYSWEKICLYSDPPESWPEYGEIKINRYSTRYRDGLDIVLKGVDCNIQASLSTVKQVSLIFELVNVFSVSEWRENWCCWPNWSWKIVSGSQPLSPDWTSRGIDRDWRLQRLTNGTGITKITLDYHTPRPGSIFGHSEAG